MRGTSQHKPVQFVSVSKWTKRISTQGKIHVHSEKHTYGDIIRYINDLKCFIMHIQCQFDRSRVRYLEHLGWAYLIMWPADVLYHKPSVYSILLLAGKVSIGCFKHSSAGAIDMKLSLNTGNNPSNTNTTDENQNSVHKLLVMKASGLMFPQSLLSIYFLGLWAMIGWGILTGLLWDL